MAALAEKKVEASKEQSEESDNDNGHWSFSINLFCNIFNKKLRY
jgi:hypothetical protein